MGGFFVCKKLFITDIPLHIIAIKAAKGVWRMTEQSEKAANKIELLDRKWLKICGVRLVEDFDKEQVELATAVGHLVIKGRELHIAQLLPEVEELVLEGEIDAMCFEEETGAKRRSFLGRLTK